MNRANVIAAIAITIAIIAWCFVVVTVYTKPSSQMTSNAQSQPSCQIVWSTTNEGGTAPYQTLETCSNYIGYDHCLIVSQNDFNNVAVSCYP